MQKHADFIAIAIVSERLTNSHIVYTVTVHEGAIWQAGSPHHKGCLHTLRYAKTTLIMALRYGRERLLYTLQCER